MQNEKAHYKMYKAGKKWLFALLFAGAVSVGAAAVGGNTVSADTTATVQTTAVTAEQTGTTTQAATSTTASETATSATASETTTQATAQSATATSQAATSTTATQQQTASAATSTATSTATSQADTTATTATASASTSASTAATQASTAALEQSTTGQTLVTTKDSQGNYSVDPDITGDPVIDIPSDQLNQYFTATDTTGVAKDFTGNTVQLTNGHESTANKYAAGTGLLIEKNQVDFTSDFTLDTTLNISWDASMGNWVGGDGTALFFENVQPSQVYKNLNTGSGMGISKDATKVISFNVSSNAIGESPESYTDADGVVHDTYPWNTWTIYESGQDTSVSIDDPIVSSTTIGTEGQVTYTWHLEYDAATRNIHTTVLDASGATLRAWDFTVPEDWVGQGFTLVNTGITADSHAAYSATVNRFKYTAATTTFNVTDSGLPAGTTGPTQTNVVGLAGSTIAFYNAGETAPTETADGTPVTHAYAVDPIGNYTLRNAQFITLDRDASKNDLTLDFAAPAKITVRYVNEVGSTIQAPTTLTGLTGDDYTYTAPAIGGYTYKGLAADSAALSGQYADPDQTITLVYTTNKGQDTTETTGTITINYVDNQGNVIKTSTSNELGIGGAYDITPEPTIGDYTYTGIAEGSAPLSGTLTGDTTITLVYTPTSGQVPDDQTGTITIRYVDTKGNVIKTTESHEMGIGGAYDVTPEQKLGDYTYVGLGQGSAPLSGTLDTANKTITLVYQPTKTRPSRPNGNGCHFVIIIKVIIIKPYWCPIIPQRPIFTGWSTCTWRTPAPKPQPRINYNAFGCFGSSFSTGYSRSPLAFGGIGSFAGCFTTGFFL